MKDFNANQKNLREDGELTGEDHDEHGDHEGHEGQQHGIPCQAQ